MELGIGEMVAFNLDPHVPEIARRNGNLKVTRIVKANSMFSPTDFENPEALTRRMTRRGVPLSFQLLMLEAAGHPAPKTAAPDLAVLTQIHADAQARAESLTQGAPEPAGEEPPQSRRQSRSLS